MSRGIGRGAVEFLARDYQSKWGKDLLKEGDVQRNIMIGGKEWPLGRFLVEKLRQEVGLDEKKVKAEGLARYRQEISEITGGALSKEKIKRLMVESKEQEAIEQEKKHKILNRRNMI